MAEADIKKNIENICLKLKRLARFSIIYSYFSATEHISYNKDRRAYGIQIPYTIATFENETVTPVKEKTWVVRQGPETLECKYECLKEAYSKAVLKAHTESPNLLERLEHIFTRYGIFKHQVDYGTDYIEVWFYRLTDPFRRVWSKRCPQTSDFFQSKQYAHELQMQLFANGLYHQMRFVFDMGVDSEHLHNIIAIHLKENLTNPQFVKKSYFLQGKFKCVITGKDKLQALPQSQAMNRNKLVAELIAGKTFKDSFLAWANHEGYSIMNTFCEPHGLANLNSYCCTLSAIFNMIFNCWTFMERFAWKKLEVSKVKTEELSFHRLQNAVYAKNIRNRWGLTSCFWELFKEYTRVGYKLQEGTMTAEEKESYVRKAALVALGNVLGYLSEWDERFKNMLYMDANFEQFVNIMQLFNSEFMEALNDDWVYRMFFHQMIFVTWCETCQSRIQVQQDGWEIFLSGKDNHFEKNAPLTEVIKEHFKSQLACNCDNAKVKLALNNNPEYIVIRLNAIKNNANRKVIPVPYLVFETRTGNVQYELSSVGIHRRMYLGHLYDPYKPDYPAPAPLTESERLSAIQEEIDHWKKLNGPDYEVPYKDEDWIDSWGHNLAYLHCNKWYRVDDYISERVNEQGNPPNTKTGEWEMSRYARLYIYHRTNIVKQPV